MARQMQIVPVPAFNDNYLWLVHDDESGETAVVDPGDAAPVLAEAQRRGWIIDQVWNTHWHPDHTGGNLSIKEATGARNLGLNENRLAARPMHTTSRAWAGPAPLRKAERIPFQPPTQSAVCLARRSADRNERVRSSAGL